jgi:hypothetical protein
LRERAVQASTTFNDLLERDPVKADKFLTENQGLIESAPLINGSLQELSELRRLRTAIEQGTEDMLKIDTKERRRMIDELRQYENETVSYVRELEAEINKRK